jgi:uncharacterized protein YsxB (DUF464 family)
VIQIRVTRSSDGCLSALTMSGHVSAAGGARGANLTCAAVTGLVRSCVETVTAADGSLADGTAEREGELSVTVRAVDGEQRDWLRGVTDVLVSGLRRMSADAPGEVELTETTATGPSPAQRTKE